MHRALLIVEIQLCIFSNILVKQALTGEDLEQNRLGKRTLNALARTCKTFSEAALDVVWRDLDSFVKLVQCMPQDLWYMEGSNYYTLGGFMGCTNLSFLHRSDTLNNSQKFRRSTTSSDWAIFQKYARRVHFIRGLYRHLPLFERVINLDDSCTLALCSPSAPARLLPNLKSLVWPVESDAQFLLLPRLLSPSLISLSLRPSNLYHPPQAPASASQISFEICPSLQYLDVKGDLFSPLSEGLKRSINQLQNLDTISWDELRSEAILSLARLPRLKYATFKIPPDFTFFVTALPSNPSILEPAFPMMCLLEISSGSLTCVTAFLNYFKTGSKIMELSFRGRGPSQAATIRELVAALGSSASRDALHNLTVCDKVSSDPTGFRPLGIRDLAPLLKFHRLQRLNLDLQCPIIIIDATLLEMADSWPDITSLPSSHATPSGLLALLETCANLRNLSLPVDFSAIDSADFDPLELRHSTDLNIHIWELSLGPFNINHPLAVAGFLALVVPSCYEIKMLWPDVEGGETTIYRQRWVETANMYRGLRGSAGLGGLSSVRLSAIYWARNLSDTSRANTGCIHTPFGTRSSPNHLHNLSPLPISRLDLCPERSQFQFGHRLSLK
ncbi:hypothetical protein BJ138DRAFT_531093 [Hygrophoropsis aurantiaca]|uniref:Uncharacterized protein n=1 Tax=Hygrophoropsis aurantiaca TaxID=72124 RepID=A0ACB8A1X4_9AGAM|nr:hypothetical protein BJ138DRAFT_531093 [Hygrophoropsis aurantiaca]